jgi:hypothetical protein
VLRLFQPDRDPDEIKPKRTYAKRTRYFARNELARLCMDVLRDAPGLITTDEIAALVIAAKGFLITHYPQPSRHGTKQERAAVSAGLNDGAQQGAISKGA